MHKKTICEAVEPSRTNRSGMADLLSNISPPNVLREQSPWRECQKISLDTELVIHKDMNSAPPNRNLIHRAIAFLASRRRRKRPDRLENYVGWIITP